MEIMPLQILLSSKILSQLVVVQHLMVLEVKMEMVDLQSVPVQQDSPPQIFLQLVLTQDVSHQVHKMPLLVLTLD